MTWLAPLGFLGLLGLIALIVIYIIKPNYQQKMISRQSDQIDSLKSEIEKLNLKLQEKDEIINSVEHLRKEMTENVQEQKRLKNEYKQLVQELKK